MKHFSLIAILLVIVSYSTAYAQFAPQLRPAETVIDGKSRAGLMVGVYDDALGLLGEFRYGIAGYTDIGLRAGLLDFDAGLNRDSTAFLLNLDVKNQMMEVRIEDPFDLSIGGQFELITGTGNSVYSFSGLSVCSYPVTLSNGKVLSPYGRLALRFEIIENAKDDFDIAFIAGSAYELGNDLLVSAEFQFDDYFGFIMGISFGL